MEKSLDKTTIYRISGNESEVLEILENNELYVFEPIMIRRITNWKKTRVNNTIQQLKNKQKITHLKRNLYVLTNKIFDNSFDVAVNMMEPAYVSFWSALSYHGLTEQQPITIQLVTRKRNIKTSLKGLKIEATNFKKEHFFGYTKINGVIVAEIEKALIDSFAYPEKAGGLQEIIKCFRNANINKKIFLVYLKKYDNKSLNARIGYVYECLFKETLNLELPTTYIKLNPKRSSGKRIKKWMIIANEEII